MAGIMAGDNTFDLLYSSGNYSSYLADGYYFHNLNDVKYVNLDKPWYNQTVRDNIIGDYIHFVSGRFAIANVKNAVAMYFNDDLYKSLGKTEDLYELVDSGKWTQAKMKEILKDTYADVNGNTERAVSVMEELVRFINEDEAVLAGNINNDPNWASFIAGKKETLIEKMKTVILK